MPDSSAVDSSAATALGSLGTLMAIALFCSPIPAFRIISARKDTGDFEGLPYLAFLSQCSVWVVYTAWTKQPLPCFTNLVGVAFEAYYCLEFARHAHGEKKVAFARACGYAGALLSLLACVALLLHNPNFVAVSAAVLNTLAYASPCKGALDVVRSKSVASMPLLLSVASFACSSTWGAYAAVVSDVAIMVPNVLGMALALAQMGVYAWFRNSRESVAALASASAAVAAAAAGAQPPDEEGGTRVVGSGARSPGAASPRGTPRRSRGDGEALLGGSDRASHDS